MLYTTYQDIVWKRGAAIAKKNPRQDYNNAWNKEHYKTYAVKIRKDRDDGQELIDFVAKQNKEGLSISQIFIEGLKRLKDES